MAKLNISAKKMNEAISSRWFSFIVDEVISRMKDYLEKIREKIDDFVEPQLRAFLMLYVTSKIWVEFVETLPEIEGPTTTVLLNSHNLTIVYEVKEGSRDVVYVKVEEAYEAGFRNFWLRRYLPQNLLEDAITYLDLTKSITIIVYEYPSHWRGSWEKGNILIGQQIKHPEMDFINPRKPIGCIDLKKNLVAITAPNERLDTSGVVYKFN